MHGILKHVKLSVLAQTDGPYNCFPPEHVADFGDLRQARLLAKI